MVANILTIVRNTVTFDDHVADSFNNPAIDPAVVAFFQLQYSADFGELRRDVRRCDDAKAGPAMLAEENCLGEVLVASAMVGHGSCFALQISGDSMKGADMRDGDVIIVRRQLIAENGEIVVALIDDEATVKRLETNDGAIRLMPENKKYRPIEVQPDSDFRVLGKVIGVSHKSKV